MDNDNQKREEEMVLRNGVIHHLLFRSYSVYLFSVILGVIFDLFFHFNLFSYFIFDYIGIVFIITGSVIAYWAQSTSGNYKEEIAKLKNKSYFNRGPYRYLRTPTHTGLFMMATGFMNLYKNPYFHFQEYKPQLNPAGEPMAQLLEAFLIAQEKNQNGKPLYGVEVIGATWRFVVMLQKDYCISKSFDCTDKEDLMKIIAILRKVKEILQTKILD